MHVSLQLSDTRVAEVQSCNKKAHEFGGEAHTALVHICADLSNAETFWAEATILKGDTEALKGDKLRSAGIDVCLWEINKACETFIYSVLVILSSKSPSEVNAEVMAGKIVY